MKLTNKLEAAYCLTRVPQASALQAWLDAPKLKKPVRSQPHPDQDARVVQINGMILDDADASFANAIFGQGSATSPATVGEDLNSGGGPITLEINSPGGSVWAAQAIITKLRDDPQNSTIHTRVVGVAASAATLVMLTGKTISMGALSNLMLHRSNTIVGGDGHSLKSRGESLLRTDVLMSKMYAARIESMNAEEILSRIDEENEWWLNSEDALEIGLVDKIESMTNGHESDSETEEEIQLHNTFSEQFNSAVLSLVA